MALNTTTLGGLLKTVYDSKSIQDQQFFKSPLLSKMGEAADASLGGSSFVFPVNVKSDESFAWVPEGQAIPAANNEVVKQASLSPLQLLGQVQITGLAKDISMSSEAAFAKGFQYNIDKKLDSVAVRKEGMLFRDGTGQLALVNETSVPDTTGAVDIDTPGVDQIRPGMNLEFFDTSTNVLEAQAKVTYVDYDNHQITLDQDISSSIGNNSKIFVAGTQTSGAIATREPNGLDNQLATSGTWNGLTLSSFPTLYSNRIAAGSVDVSEDMLQRACNRVEQRTDADPMGGDYSVILNPDQRRKYLDLVVPSKQFTGLSLDAGYKSLAFNGMPFVVSNQCQRDRIYVGPISSFERFTTPNGRLQIESEYGGAIKWNPGFDSCVVYFREYSNNAVRHPAAWTVITGLSTVTR